MQAVRLGADPATVTFWQERRMSLDDAFRSSADMVREAAADDARREYADWLAQREYESDEAELARWSGIFRRADAEREAVVYDDRPAIDRRLFAVDGDLVEQTRRDRERHDPPGWAS
jgi:hypothetical protein